jgi:hypothetical protein
MISQIKSLGSNLLINALTGQVELPQNHLSGNPTNRELTFPSSRRFERLA